MLQSSLPLPSKLILHVSTFLSPSEMNSLATTSATMSRVSKSEYVSITVEWMNKIKSENIAENSSGCCMLCFNF